MTLSRAMVPITEITEARMLWSTVIFDYIGKTALAKFWTILTLFWKKI